jgi:SAM-dependent methyltransferase
MSGAHRPAADTRSPDERLAREIEHHRKIAPFAEAIWSWSSPSGTARAERRARLFVEQGALAPGRRALELGCGTAVFLERVARSGAAIVGLDLSEDLLAKARARMSPFANVVLARGNAEALPYPEASFDVVYGSSVLHHLDLDAALREAHRVLRPGGRIVFAEPNAINPQLVLLFRIKRLRERFGVSPDELAFSRWRAHAALTGAGFADVQVTPYDFLHPSTPRALVAAVARVSLLLERVPLLREIAGSLLIRGQRP